MPATALRRAAPPARPAPLTGRARLVPLVERTAAPLTRSLRAEVAVAAGEPSSATTACAVV